MPPKESKRDWNPAATIAIVVIVQIGLALWWGGEINHRVAALEADKKAAECIVQDVAGMKRDIEWIKSTLERMESRR